MSEYNKQIGINKIGSMVFPNGSRMEIGDPCYMGDIVQTNFKRGTYNCYAVIKDEETWGRRIAQMYVIHEDFDNDGTVTTNWNAHERWLGVDAGLMSINVDDYLPYHDELLNELYKAEEKSKKHANIIDKKHFVTSTGYGDGSYETFVARETNKSGLIIALGVVFISEDEEE